MNIGVLSPFSECLGMIADGKRDDSACCIVGRTGLSFGVNWDGERFWIDCRVDFCRNDYAQVAVGATASVGGHDGGGGF